MPEWNQPPGGGTQTLDGLVEKVRHQLKKFKGGSILILVAGVVVMVLWTA